MSIVAQGIVKKIKRGKTGNTFTVINNVSIELSKAELVVLTGKSGSGKSTLLNILSGQLRPTEGIVTVDDVDLYSLKDNQISYIRSKEFGYISQIPNPINSLTVLHNVLLPYTLFDSSKDYYNPENEEYKRAIELLQRLGIEHLKNSFPTELSGGELKRVLIARALIRKPTYIFADEPTADLDDENTSLVLQLLKEQAIEGASVIVATHERDAERFADRSISIGSL